MSNTLRSGSQKAPKILCRSEIMNRLLEVEIARTISKTSNQVISTGGGIVCNEAAISNFKKQYICLLMLQFQNDTRASAKRDNLPLFRGEEKASVLSEYSEPIYRKFADFVVEIKEMDTPKKPPKASSQRIRLVIRAKFGHKNRNESIFPPHSQPQQSFPP